MFCLLFLPFILLRSVIKSVVLLITLPFVLLAIGAAMAVAFLAVLLAVALPLLPFAVIALFVWAVTRSSRAASVIPG